MPLFPWARPLTLLKIKQMPLLRNRPQLLWACRACRFTSTSCPSISSSKTELQVSAPHSHQTKKKIVLKLAKLFSINVKPSLKVKEQKLRQVTKPSSCCAWVLGSAEGHLGDRLCTGLKEEQGHCDDEEEEAGESEEEPSLRRLPSRSRDERLQREAEISARNSFKPLVWSYIWRGRDPDALLPSSLSAFLMK